MLIFGDLGKDALERPAAFATSSTPLLHHAEGEIRPLISLAASATAALKSANFGGDDGEPCRRPPLGPLQRPR